MFKHAEHVCHIACVEMGEVDCLETLACGKHKAHRTNAAGIEVFESLNVFKMPHFCKPRRAVVRAIVCETGIEHHCLHVFCDAYPLGTSFIIVSLSHNAHAIGFLWLLATIAEGQGLVLGIKNGIGNSLNIFCTNLHYQCLLQEGDEKQCKPVP